MRTPETVAYKFGNAAACYALEGSVAITGALVQWLRTAWDDREEFRCELPRDLSA